MRGKAAKAAMALLGMGLLLAAAQAVVVERLTLHPPLPRPDEIFDLVCSFGGMNDRVELAERYCQRGQGRAFVASDADQAEVAAYFKSYGRPGNAEVILEPYARTTDENARLVARIIRTRNFHSVLLVTSWYHLPRAYLLLRLGLVGSGVQVAAAPAENLPPDFWNDPRFRIEFPKLWGSLARWTKSLLRKHGLIPGEKVLPVD